MASVIWLPNENRWSMRVSVNGISKRFTSSKPGIAGKKDVLKKYRAFFEGEAFENLLFSDAWARFLDYIIDKNGKGEAYINLEKYGRLYILPKLGKKLLSTCTLPDFQECISKARRSSGGTAPLSRRTLKNLKASIMQFVHYAVACGYMDPLRGALYIPKTAPSNERVILQPDDIARLFTPSTAATWYVNIFRFALVTGLRTGEVLGIQNGDIQNNVLTIKRAVNCRNQITEGKNQNARRQIYLNKIARRIISENQFRNGKLATPWVFCSKTGAPLSQSSLRKAWIRLAEEKNLPGTPYSLRHTFVSLLKNEMPEAMLKSILGHSSTMPTYEIYGHVVNGEAEAAAKIIDINFAKFDSSEKE